MRTYCKGAANALARKSTQMRDEMVQGARSIAVAALGLVLLAPPAARAAVSPRCAAVEVANTPPYANGGTSYMCPVDTSRFRNALCNDGTPGMFQVQPAADPASRTWVIWLAGGYECVDARSCAARATNPKTAALTTSTGTRPRAGHGVLSHDAALDPVFAGANTVQVHYCSNDLWSGSRRAPNGPDGFVATDPATWNFEGRAIVAGTISTLKTLGFGFGTATTVVLGGTSSGAYGAAVVLNDVLRLLPPKARVRLLLDAGFTLDLGAFDARLPSPSVAPGPDTPFRSVVGQGMALWHGRGDATCDARAVTTADRVACYDTARLLQGGYLAVPTFVAESLIDSAELPGQLCPAGGPCRLPRDPLSPQGQYVTYYGQRMAALLAGPGGGAGTPPYRAFAPDAYVHALLNDDAVFTTPFPFAAGALAARDALAAWYGSGASGGGALLGTGPGVQ